MNARDRRICEMAMLGHTNAEIGVEIGKSKQMVGLYLKKIYADLGITGNAGGMKRGQLYNYRDKIREKDEE